MEIIECIREDLEGLEPTEVVGALAAIPAFWLLAFLACL